MAKIKQNNFLDTVDEVFTNAREAGVLHLHADGPNFSGRTITIGQKEHYHFGTTGYLGLEQDDRLKEAAVEAIRKYGTQFPLSKSYISHPLYAGLEEKVQKIYGYPVIITKNSTLGHLAVIPSAVRDEDAVILDHQVHWSVQNATQLLKTRGIPVEMIRHNNLEMLEDKIRSLSDKCRKIWYMADGVYSMYGDYAPVKELVQLSEKYSQLHLYFDDVHGMSWKGRNGGGYIMETLGELQDNMLLIGTLSKTFGASGSLVVCPDKELHSRIKTYGGPLTFSAQLEPASVAAASASADIHLSPEINELQVQLQTRILYFNELLEETALPLIKRNDSPVFYIGTGMPVTGYDFVKRLMNEGFYVNLGIYPAVPVKNTGVRITISRHNEFPEIKGLVSAMEYHFPLALENSNTTLKRIRRAFRLPEVPVEDKEVRDNQKGLRPAVHTSIRGVEKELWNRMFSGRGVLDWEGQMFLEESFRNNDRKEHNWSFFYLLILDGENNPVAATALTHSLWKDDLLAPPSTSEKIEEKRKENPYYLTSYVLSAGSLFTEGDHLFHDQSHPLCGPALEMLLQQLETLEAKLPDAALLVLRDFREASGYNSFFHARGFVKMQMPDSCRIEDLQEKFRPDFPSNLSKRSRRHFTKEILAYEQMFILDISDKASEADTKEFHRLYQHVKNNNLGLNTFLFPEKLFRKMSEHPQWEFISLFLPPNHTGLEQTALVGVMFCYKNGATYVPAFIGLDYRYSREFNTYRQLLYQSIRRAQALGFEHMDLGLTAPFEKKKLGATVSSKYSYVQAKDNFSMEHLGAIQSAD